MTVNRINVLSAFFVLVYTFSTCFLQTAAFMATVENAFLSGYALKTSRSDPVDWLECLMDCYNTQDCVSYNYNPQKQSCQLNSFGLTDLNTLSVAQDFVFHQIKPAVRSTIVNVASKDQGNCECNCGTDRQCFNKPKPKPRPNRPGKGDIPRKAAASCKEIWDVRGTVPSKAYYVKVVAYPAHRQVYCQMEHIPGCGRGGWTLIMKIDGTKDTFGFSSQYWKNYIEFNATAAKDLSPVETKSATFWSTSFQKLCMGMSYKGHTSWMAIQLQEKKTLFDLTSSYQKTPTSLTVNEWKALLSNSSLQTGCTLQGFNVENTAAARIGIIGFPNTCGGSAQSRLGFGTSGSTYNIDGTNSCGNEARNYPDNGDRSMKAFGYILVQ